MQRMWRGAVTLLELSTSFSVVQPLVKTLNRHSDRKSQTGQERQRKGKGGWWKIDVHTEDDDRKISEQRCQVGEGEDSFCLSVGFRRQPYPRPQCLHIYCCQWIKGLANPPHQAPPNTHTSLPLSPKAPRCGSEASALLSWREITFESGCYLWRIRLYWPEEMTVCFLLVRAIELHTHKRTCTQAGDTKVYTVDWLFWHLAEDRFGWLAGFTSASSSLIPPPLSVSFLLNTVKFSAARPVTAVERQPVLSVLSALAFSWLGEMLVSILHQYPFISITLVFLWLTENTHRGESNSYQKKVANFWFWFTHCCM